MSEEPNLASPHLGREENLSRFGGPAVENGNPAISVLSGGDNDPESMEEQHQKLIAQHIAEDREASVEVKEEKQVLDVLTKTLRAQREDLYSSLPSKDFSRKSKHKPIRSEASVQLHAQRKVFLNVMQKTVIARERNKYLNTAMTMTSEQKKLQDKNAALGPTSKGSSLDPRA